MVQRGNLLVELSVGLDKGHFVGLEGFHSCLEVSNVNLALVEESGHIHGILFLLSELLGQCDVSLFKGLAFQDATLKLSPESIGSMIGSTQLIGQVDNNSVEVGHLFCESSVGLLQRTALGLSGGERVGVVGAIGSDSVQLGGDIGCLGVDDRDLVGKRNICRLKLATPGLARGEFRLEVVELGTEGVVLGGQVIDRGGKMGDLIVQSGIGLFQLGTTLLKGRISLSKVTVVDSDLIERHIQDIDLVVESSDLIGEGSVSCLHLLELGAQVVVLDGEIVHLNSRCVKLSSQVRNGSVQSINLFRYRDVGCSIVITLD